MSYAISRLSVCPIRSTPEDSSEMTSQLLFGEVVELMSGKKNDFCEVKCHFDGYTGWMDRKQLVPWEGDPQQSQPVVLDLVEPAFAGDHTTLITIGANLPGYDGITATINEVKYRFSGQVMNGSPLDNPAALIEKLARKFLNAPYLWGGRTPFGIDCSGLTQVLFKCVGVRLQRDSQQQAKQGRDIDFFDQAKPGDMAFFSRKGDHISHVGIILSDKRIIHASGQVRIDLLDHYGLFNEDIQEYTHRLKIIKRII